MCYSLQDTGTAAANTATVVSRGDAFLDCNELFVACCNLSDRSGKGERKIPYALVTVAVYSFVIDDRPRVLVTVTNMSTLADVIIIGWRYQRCYRHVCVASVAVSENWSKFINVIKVSI